MIQSPPPSLEPQGLLSGLQWACIVRGVLVDIGLTVVASVPLMLFLVGAAAFSENEDLANQAIDQAFASPEGLFCGALVGLCATVAGAFYGARRAGAEHLRHGGWVGVLSLLVGLPLLLVPGLQSSIPNPAWYDILTLVSIVPAGLLGGALAARLTPAAPS